jgi:hypothetical protein
MSKLTPEDVPNLEPGTVVRMAGTMWYVVGGNSAFDLGDEVEVVGHVSNPEGWSPEAKEVAGRIAVALATEQPAGEEQS